MYQTTSWPNTSKYIKIHLDSTPHILEDILIPKIEIGVQEMALKSRQVSIN